MPGIARSPRIASPVRGRASLTLTLNGARYSVRPIRSDDAEILVAWRLRKLGADAAHVVAATASGPTCECGDFTWRRAGTGLPCKHIAALRAVGLLPS